MSGSRIRSLLPFLAWFPMDRASVRADLVAGVTVALVLVPQSMAYAQLAGMPAVYGLYAAFLPVMVAALFGSSRQLATGPVAVVSLLTASALAPIVAPGTEAYVALAVAMTLLVGAIQIALGLFRLGVMVNFLSHPVIAGFSSAAAIVIGLSQLDKILGVPRPRSDFFLADVWGVVAQAGEAHWPTIAFGVLPFAVMLALRRLAPALPGVLIVVAACTAISAAVDFEKHDRVDVAAISDLEARALATDHVATRARIEALTTERREKSAERRAIGPADRERALHAAALGFQIDVIGLEIEDQERENRRRLRLLRQLAFERAGDATGRPVFVAPGTLAGADATRWRIRAIDERGVLMAGGGDVVGAIPAGLPPLKLPKIDLGILAQLLSTALVIALVGFMEAISIAKTMAARTRQRLDANQELIGQGLANLVGALTQCYPSSGSFSRSAIAFAAGARTGLASVITSLLVMLTLLFLTPLLYHLPQATLAAVIMLAVVSLVNFGAIAHAWRARRHDGVAGAATFVGTLALAPHLDLGILVGAGLSLVLFLFRTMKPRTALLERHEDGTLHEAAGEAPGAGDRVVAVRFDGQIYFANVPYFEDLLLDVPARFPRVTQLLVVADGINQIDASGDEAVSQLAQRLREAGVTLSFSGLKRQVRDVLAATGTLETIGPENVFANERRAIEALARRADEAPGPGMAAGEPSPAPARP